MRFLGINGKKKKRNNECRMTNLSSWSARVSISNASLTPCSPSLLGMDGHADGLALWAQHPAMYSTPSRLRGGGSGGSGSCAGRRWADSFFVNCWRSWGGILSLSLGTAARPLGWAANFRAKPWPAALVWQPQIAFLVLLGCAGGGRHPSPSLGRCIWCLPSTANGSDVAPLARFKAPSLFMRARCSSHRSPYSTRDEITLLVQSACQTCSAAPQSLKHRRQWPFSTVVGCYPSSQALRTMHLICFQNPSSSSAQQGPGHIIGYWKQHE